MSDRITTAYLHSGTQVGPSLRPLDEKLGPLARTINRIRLGDQDFEVHVFTKEERPLAINLYTREDALRNRMEDDLRYVEEIKTLEALEAKRHLSETEITESMRILRTLHGDGVGFKLVPVQLRSE